MNPALNQGSLPGLAVGFWCRPVYVRDKCLLLLFTVVTIVASVAGCVVAVAVAVNSSAVAPPAKEKAPAKPRCWVLFYVPFASQSTAWLLVGNVDPDKLLGQWSCRTYF